MRLGMLQNISDPNVIWDVLTEVADAARTQLEPLGYGLHGGMNSRIRRIAALESSPHIVSTRLSWTI